MATALLWKSRKDKSFESSSLSLTATRYEKIRLCFMVAGIGALIGVPALAYIFQYNQMPLSAIEYLVLFCGGMVCCIGLLLIGFKPNETEH